MIVLRRLTALALIGVSLASCRSVPSTSIAHTWNLYETGQTVGAGKSSGTVCLVNFNQTFTGSIVQSQPQTTYNTFGITWLDFAYVRGILDRWDAGGNLRSSITRLGGLDIDADIGVRLWTKVRLTNADSPLATSLIGGYGAVGGSPSTVNEQNISSTMTYLYGALPVSYYFDEHTSLTLTAGLFSIIHTLRGTRFFRDPQFPQSAGNFTPFVQQQTGLMPSISVGLKGFQGKSDTQRDTSVIFVRPQITVGLWQQKPIISIGMSFQWGD